MAELFLNVGFGFRKTNNPAAFLPLTPLFEQFHALETFQNVSFRRDCACSLETAMLRHKKFVPVK
jgi:hypothetical protein